MSKEKIQIIKHENPEPLKEYGDILFPFKDWDTTTTGDGWYSKIPEDFYENKRYYLLSSVSQNSWKTLVRLGVNCFDFKESVQYECPYNGYIHFWCVPVVIFTDNLDYWLEQHKTPFSNMLKDFAYMKKFFPLKTKNGLPFTKIQRALLGPGYTSATNMDDGSGYLYDAIVALSNGDFLGVKVWMWFNK